MDLYIVRHGQAGEHRPTPQADRRRPLTARGRRETAAVAGALSKLKYVPEKILTSPLVRAAETSAILAKGLKSSAPEICRHLSPGGDPRQLLLQLANTSGNPVMLVGHMPDLGELVSVLLADSKELNILFKKSGVCCVGFDGPPKAGAARLKWLLQTKHLFAIGKK